MLYGVKLVILPLSAFAETETTSSRAIIHNNKTVFFKQLTSFQGAIKYLDLANHTHYNSMNCCAFGKIASLIVRVGDLDMQLYNLYWRYFRLRD